MTRIHRQPVDVAPHLSVTAHEHTCSGCEETRACYSGQMFSECHTDCWRCRQGWPVLRPITKETTK